MRKLVLCLTLFATLGAAGCGADDDAAARRARRAVEGGDAVRVLEHSPWLDKAPRHETDVIQLYAFARGEGVFFVGNQHKGSYETFAWFAEDDELRLRFLAENQTYKTRFTIERIDDRVFDYKLTLSSSPRGPKTYYGFASHRDAAIPAAARQAVRMLATPAP